MTKLSLKRVLSRYPQLAIDMLSTPVKSAKSIVMRAFNISETEYLAAVKKIQRQTNYRSGPLFRGNMLFTVAVLREEAGLSDDDLAHVFQHYPTIFTLDYDHISRRLKFLRREIG